MGLQHNYIIEEGRVPLASEMMQAEIVVNSVDGKLYAKNSAETVFRLLTTLDRRSDVRALGSTDDSVVTETGIRAAINAAVSGVTGVWGVSGTNIYNLNTGNVGIGTSAPECSLQVAGTMKAVKLALGSASATSSYRIDITTGSGETDFFRMSGNGVAVGNGFFRITNSTVSPNVFEPIFWAKSNSSYIGLWFLADTQTDSGSYSLMKFEARQNNTTVVNRPLFTWFNRATEVMRINASGVLGLGTATPSARLDVDYISAPATMLRLRGSSTMANFIAYNTSAGGYDLNLIKFDYQNSTVTANLMNVGVSGTNYVGAQAVLSHLYIGASSASSGLRVYSNRNVTVGNFLGVNTSNPQAYLDVNGEAIFRPEAAAFYFAYDQMGGEAGLYNLNTGNLIVGHTLNDDSVLMLGYNVLFVDQNNSAVGIGTGSPTSALDIAGSVTAYTAKFSNVGAVAASSLLGRDNTGALTTNVMPLVFASIHPHIAGLGLNGNSYNGSADTTWSVNFSGNGIASSASRSDHNHDDQYAAYGHNHYLTTLADVLIDTLADGDVLIYDLTSDNWVNVPVGVQYWSRNAGYLSPSNANDAIFLESNKAVSLEIYNTNDGTTPGVTIVGVSSSVVNGIGLYGSSGMYGVFGEGIGTATGVFAISMDGIGLEALTENGLAINATATGSGNAFIASALGDGFAANLFSHDGTPLHIGCNPDYDDGLYTMIEIERNFAGGTPSDGIGAAIDFHIQGSGSSFLNSRFASTLTTSNNLHITSNFEWSLISDGLFRQVMELSGGGVLTVNGGFATTSGSGISGTYYMLTGIGVESGTRNLIIGRSSITLSGGIVIAHEDLSNIIIPLP